MDRNQAKEFFPIMQAFAEGRVIECRTKTSAVEGTDVPNDRTEMKEIEYWNNTEYRIKPEVKFRPFANAKECWTEMQKHQPFGWVKYLSCYYNITAVSNTDVVLANFSRCTFTQSFIKIMNDYTFADGTPFGVKIKEV